MARVVRAGSGSVVNDDFDANSFFTNATRVPKEQLIRNQFGFGVG